MTQVADDRFWAKVDDIWGDYLGDNDLARVRRRLKGLGMDKKTIDGMVKDMTS